LLLAGAIPSLTQLRTAALSGRHATRPMAPDSRTTVRKLAVDAEVTLEDRPRYLLKDIDGGSQLLAIAGP